MGPHWKQDEQRLSWIIWKNCVTKSAFLLNRIVFSMGVLFMRAPKACVYNEAGRVLQKQILDYQSGNKDAKPIVFGSLVFVLSISKEPLLVEMGEELYGRPVQLKNREIWTNCHR